MANGFIWVPCLIVLEWLIFRTDYVFAFMTSVSIASGKLPQDYQSWDVISLFHLYFTLLPRPHIISSVILVGWLTVYRQVFPPHCFCYFPIVFCGKWWKADGLGSPCADWSRTLRIVQHIVDCDSDPVHSYWLVLTCSMYSLTILANFVCEISNSPTERLKNKRMHTFSSYLILNLHLIIFAVDSWINQLSHWVCTSVTGAQSNSCCNHLLCDVHLEARL